MDILSTANPSSHFHRETALVLHSNEFPHGAHSYVGRDCDILYREMEANETDSRLLTRIGRLPPKQLSSAFHFKITACIYSCIFQPYVLWH